MSSQGQDEQRHLQLVDTHLLPNRVCIDIMATFCLLFYPCLLGFLIFRVSGPGGVPSCSGQTQSSGIRIDTSLHQNVES